MDCFFTQAPTHTHTHTSRDSYAHSGMNALNAEQAELRNMKHQVLGIVAAVNRTHGRTHWHRHL